MYNHCLKPARFFIGGNPCKRPNEVFTSCTVSCTPVYCPTDDIERVVICDTPSPCDAGCVCAHNHRRLSVCNDTCILAENCRKYCFVLLLELLNFIQSSKYIFFSFVLSPLKKMTLPVNYLAVEKR